MNETADNSMRKVLLIQAPWEKQTKSIFRYLHGVFPPLGLATIASFLEKVGHEVSIIDCTAEFIKPENIIEHIDKSYDFVGISATTATAPGGYKIAELIKEKMNGAVVIFGGVHATAMPEEVISQPAIDICVRGEGEETIKEIVAGVPLKEIKGITFKENGSAIHNADRAMIRDLDAYPLPAYHLLPMKKYRSITGAAIKEPSIGLVVSRGCPAKCEYCYTAVLGKKMRMKSPNRILEEISLLKNKYGIKEIDFYDDTFTVNKKVIGEVCNLLIQNKVNIAWSCLTRMDYVDEDLLKLMKRAGCHQVMYGVEAGRQEVRDAIGKKLSVDIKNIFKMTQKIGIQIRATYMIGNYVETREDVLETIKKSIEYDSEYAIFNVTTPFPGTELYKRLDKENRILHKDWAKYDFYNVVFSHPNLSAEEIETFYQQANKQFYFRPIMFFKHFKNLFSSLNMIKMYSRAAIGMTRAIWGWYFNNSVSVDLIKKIYTQKIGKYLKQKRT